MRVLLLIISCTLVISVAHAQDQDHPEIREVILDIFEGMRQGDSTRVARHILPDATMITVIQNEQGETVKRTGNLQSWLTAIATPRERMLDERLWNTEVRRDGPLATVWTEYALYIGDELSHCGIDAFQLLHDGERWQVFHVADTRRKECNIPDFIAK